jgi:hypothetical protein
MELRVDNQAALRQIVSEETSTKTKHIDIKIKYVKELFKQGFINPVYVSTTEMKADLLTKPLGATRLKELIRLLKME